MTAPDIPIDVVPVDRTAYNPAEQIAALQRQVDDLTSTLMVRVNRRPTGDIEPTIRSTAKADTLIMNGQTPLRTDYPVLWQWAQDQGLVIAGLFTNGNTTTTFGLPDFRGRVPVGVGTLGADTFALGDYDGIALFSKTLSTSNMPNHSHGVSVDDHGAHAHGISGDGSHSGHQPSGFGGAGGGAALIQQNDTVNGFHNHGSAVGNTNVSGHNLSETPVGGSTAFTIDTHQPSIAINWLIYV